MTKTTENHKKLYNDIHNLESLFNTTFQNNINKLDSKHQIIILYDDKQTEKVK